MFSNINNSCPWTENGNCTGGFVPLNIGKAPSYIAIISCTFSCLGSILIILTFFMLKDMRTGSQKIVTMLAVADLISALGYIIGSANYLQHQNSTIATGCGSFNKVCIGQATVTTYSSLVSFLWTVILAFYFFLIIVYKRAKVASRLMVIYSIIAWVGPLSVVVPLLAWNRLGYSHFAASNWCYVKGSDESLANDWEMTLVILVAGKFWEISSYILVTILCVAITVVFSKTRKQVKMESRVQTVHVEARLLLIPVIFILLRIWGTLQFFVSIGTSGKIDKSTSCIPHTINIVFQVLGILQAIGDGGQGWGNAILYIFLSPIIRERLIQEWCGKCLEKYDELDPGKSNNVQSDNTGINHTGPPRSKDYSDETAPILPRSKAAGYSIRKYDNTTSVTEGFATGTDISFS